MAGSVKQARAKIWTRNFSLITIVNFFLLFGLMFIQPTIQVHAKDLGASDSIIGLIGALFTFTALLARPLTGSGMDRLGRRRILLTALLALALATFAYIGSITLVLLIVIRIIHGITWGSAHTAVQTVAADFTPRENYGEANGLYNLSTGLGRTLAPLLTFQVMAIGGFRPVVLIAGTAFLLAFFLSTAIEHRQVKAVRTAVDDEATRLTVSVSRTDAGQNDLPKEKQRLLERSALPATLLIFIVNLTYGSVNGFIAVYAHARGFSHVGLFLALLSLSSMLFRPILGSLVDRYGKAVVLYPSLLCITAGIVLLSQATRMPLYVISAFIYGLGTAGTEVALMTWVITQADPKRLGAANSTFFFGLDGGITVGNIMAGMIAGGLGYSSMYLIMGLPPLIALAIAHVFFRRTA